MDTPFVIIEFFEVVNLTHFVFDVKFAFIVKNENVVECVCHVTPGFLNYSNQLDVHYHDRIELLLLQPHSKFPLRESISDLMTIYLE